MAVKVIKAGVDPTRTPLRLQCSNCGCQLECLPSDLRVQNDRNDVFRYISCPTCNSFIYTP